MLLRKDAEGKVQQLQEQTEVDNHPTKKKRRASYKKTQTQQDESAKKKRDHDHRRNAKRREDAAKERQIRLQQDISSWIVPMLFSVALLLYFCSVAC